MPLLEVEGLHARYGYAPVVQGVSFSADAGEIVSIFGRNGAGKTTTLRTIMGLWRARKGAIVFRHHDVTAMHTSDIARLGIAFVPENMGIFGGLTVEENMKLAAHGGRFDKSRLERIFALFPAMEKFWDRQAHALSGPTLDRFFVVVSALGYQWGVVPVDIALTAALLVARRWREATFAGVSFAGSALLNMATKQFFQRDRPTLWESIAPEHTFSFPSGHAMGSATLAMVVVLLCWHTRWRWLAVALATLFALLVGASRIYLGVHYPSDILGGFAAGIAWVSGVYLVLFRIRERPWQVKG